MIYDVSGNELTTDAGKLDAVFPVFDEKFIVSISNPSSILTTFSAVYDAYDTILAGVTHEKNLIGYGTASNGTEDTNLPIYEYVINNPVEPSDDVSSVYRIRNAPKICLTSGIHGTERSAVIALMEVIKAIIASADDATKVLRNMAQWRVVPIINPGGYNDGTRNNRHDVNLNRNFLPYWSTQTASGNKGAEPYSEYETKALRDWAAEQSPTTLFMMDFHNFVRDTFPETYTYMFTDYPLFWEAFSVVYRGLVPHFASQSIDLTSYPKTQERNLVAGIASEFYVLHGVDAGGIETPWNGSNPTDGQYVKPGAVIQGSFLRYMLENYLVKPET